MKFSHSMLLDKDTLISMLIGIVSLSLFSCASNPYRKTDRFHDKRAKYLSKSMHQRSEQKDTSDLQLKWVGTTNFNLRKPNYVVIHHTAQHSIEQTLRTFTLPRTQVSAHYVVSRNGDTYQMLGDMYRAWHAGIGSWGGNTDINSSSIGIELDNDGYEEFSEEQIESLLKLLKELKEKYNIPAHNIIGHSDLAPGRKVDPNPSFPWKKLAHKGFGIWYEKDLNELKFIDKILRDVSIEPAQLRLPEKAPDFDVEVALKVIGYDISDLEAAIQSFKIHYVQSRIKKPLNEEEKIKLYQIYQIFLHL